jgi:hypothetical protein
MEEKDKQKLTNGLAIISAVAGWTVLFLTEYYGGLVLFVVFAKYWFIPLIGLISFIETVIYLFKKGLRKSKIKLFSHGSVFLVLILLGLCHSNLFKSKEILTATLHDEHFSYTLIFRKNGEVENHIFGMFFHTQTIKGTYVMKGDTIIFTKKPYDNNFIPDTLLWDKEKNALMMYRNGHIPTDIYQGNYFNVKK